MKRKKPVEESKNLIGVVVVSMKKKVSSIESKIKIRKSSKSAAGVIDSAKLIKEGSIRVAAEERLKSMRYEDKKSFRKHQSASAENERK